MVAVGLFSVKSYPYRNTPLFKLFSEEERRLLLSDNFDGTNTPRFETFHDIPAPYFTVGTIELIYDIETPEDFFEITVETLDSIKTIMKLDDDPLGIYDNNQNNVILRAVPGWELSYNLFNSLCLIHYFHFRKQPTRTVLRESGGFVTVSDESGAVSSVDDECSKLMSISVSFHKGNSVYAETFDDDNWHSKDEKDIQIIISGVPGPEDYQNSMTRAFPDSFGINPEWWSVAQEDFLCDLNTPCGCS